jgi:hypothetical protein
MIYSLGDLLDLLAIPVGFARIVREETADPTVREFADSVIDLQDAVIEFDLLDYLTETDPLSD